MKLNVGFVLLISFLIFLFSDTAYSEIYKWVDDKGEAHFTDNPSAIPPQYLNQIQRKPVKETAVPPSVKGADKDIKDKIPVESPVVKAKEAEKSTASVKEGIQPDDAGAVTLDGTIKEDAKEKRERVIYSGIAKNNSNAELNNVEIFFTIKGKDGKEENISSLIKGKKGDGILGEDESGSFSIQPETPFPSITGYGYNFKWRFITTQER